MNSQITFSEFLVKYQKNGITHEDGGFYHALVHADREFFLQWDITSQSVGTMSNNPFRQAQYQLVVMATLGAHCAIQNGVNSELAYAYSDYYCLLSDETKTISELNKLVKQAALLYCDLVDQVKSSSFSRITNLAIEYIRNNIYFTIYTSKIAKYLGVNSSYLSKSFKEDTGITLKTYIHIEKIKTAKSLMTYDNLSLTEVATHMGYSDLSHFSRICKTYVQMSPKEIQKMSYNAFIEHLNPTK